MRKSLWSSRWASIKDAMFSYKKDKNDKEIRQIIDLRKAKIAKGTRSSGEPYFQLITDNLEIKLRPETLEEYKNWALILSESLKSDE